MLVPFFVFALACSDGEDAPEDTADTPTPTAESSSPTSTPGSSEPGTPAPEPGLFVVEPGTGNGTQATPGTRCWGNGCVDYIGPVTRDEPVTFTAGAELGWQAEGGTADEVSHAWVSRGDVEPADVGDNTLLWRVTNLDFDGGDQISVPDDPGEYLLVIFIRYTSGDDVLWGLYVNAE
jgi:hypothetical protein